MRKAKRKREEEEEEETQKRTGTRRNSGMLEQNSGRKTCSFSLGKEDLDLGQRKTILEDVQDRPCEEGEKEEEGRKTKDMRKILSRLFFYCCFCQSEQDVARLQFSGNSNYFT